jgi:hypothetical protein
MIYEEAITEATVFGEGFALLAYAAVADSFTLNDTPKSALTAYMLENMTLADTLRSGFLVRLAESMGVADTNESALIGQRRIDELFVIDGRPMDMAALNEGVALAAILASVRGAKVAESFSLGEVLLQAFGVSLSEFFTLDEAALQSLVGMHSIDEALTIDDTPSATGTLAVTVAEAFAFDEALSLNQLIQALIAESITFGVELALDGEDYLAWVMNTETFGVTNYENFRFNSMCGFGGAYYATDGEKIYRLDGDTDDGTAIDAEISLGATDFGSSFLKSADRAYLGLRSDGQMVLKVITDEKTEDWYQLEAVPTALGQTRVKIGKGLKARYWRLSLRNKAGGDFSLDSLRLIPLKLTRRIGHGQ